MRGRLLLIPPLLLLLLTLHSISGQHLICDQRRIEGHSPIKQAGDGGFRISVLGPLSSKGLYAPNEVYTVTIQGLKTRYSTQKLTEFLLVAESEKQAMMGPSGLVTTGLFHIVDEAQTRFSDICPDGVTSLNRQPKGQVSVLWTAPSILVASCVTFKSLVVERPHVWFMDDGNLTLTLCPQLPGAAPPPPSRTTPHLNQSSTLPLPPRQLSPTSSLSSAYSNRQFTATPTSSTLGGNTISSITQGQPTVTTCCACDEAKYDVEFEGIWSKETHPKDFPDNAWLLHFSDIIGASHSPSMWVWREGEPASAGMRQVAEWGSTRALETELKAQAPNINTIIKARGLWHPNEKGKSSGAFRVDPSRHLVSLVSMLGPSPDWIVGVSNLPLCLPNCTWIPEVNLDLFPYDAGTDSGITYMSPNTPTSPPGPIRRLTPTQPNDPRSPFHGLDPKTIAPFAKLTLRRQRIYPKECGDNSSSSSSASHLFLTENSEDDIERMECRVTEFTPWSECSVRCGKGLRMRKRLYLLPDKADMFRCDRQLVEKEMCLGATPTCPPDELEDADMGVCAVTLWSEWSPCSLTCGEGGKRTRTRRYKNHMGRKRCSIELSDGESCGGGIPCANSPASSDHTRNLASTPEDPKETACPISPWSEWSPCSVSCGSGIRLRSRVLLIQQDDGNTEVNTDSCSHLTLREAETCVGEYGGSCEVKREEAANLCILPPETGPCRDHRQRYYYHPMKAVCLPFTYGGCKGNRNRFDTEGECSQVCGFLAEEVAEATTPSVSTTKTTTFSLYKKRTTTTPTPPTTSRSRGGSLDHYFDTFTTAATPRPSYSYPYASSPSYYYYTTTTTPTTTTRYSPPLVIEEHSAEESLNLDLGAAAVTETVPPPPEPLIARLHHTTAKTMDPVSTKPPPIGVELGVIVNEREGEDLVEEDKDAGGDGGNSGRVDCVVSPWSEWSICSVPCGGGFRTRIRAVVHQPTPDGRRCPRKLTKRKPCSMPPC